MLPDFYPGASQIITPHKNLVAPFAAGDPCGLTIHYTATRTVDQAYRALMDRGLNYHLMIDRDGSIVQTAKLSHRVHHAGNAIWHGKSPNRSHISIALVSWGHVKPDGTTWTGRKTDLREVVPRVGRWWHVATNAQEAALVATCQWFVCQGIKVENICGHDECAIPKGRKADPGGVLPYTMDELRRLVVSVRQAGRKP